MKVLAQGCKEYMNERLKHSYCIARHDLPTESMALRVSRCMLVALTGQYAVALRLTRRATIARVAAAATGCVAATATAADVPLVGRFARNEGAKEFVGDWRLETTTGAKGRLVFLSTGDCQLFDGAKLLGESAVPWKYAGRRGIVSVSFTLDLPTISDDVLILDGTIEEDGALRGVVYAGDAEMGARGAGAKTRVGDFVATR